MTIIAYYSVVKNDKVSFSNGKVQITEKDILDILEKKIQNNELDFNTDTWNIDRRSLELEISENN